MEKVYLPSSGKELKIERCEKCNAKMVNVDREELKEMDAKFLNMIGVRWSNPKTGKLVCVECEIREHFNFQPSKKRKEEDDDSWSQPASPGSVFGGLGRIGGFGGFGGGGFGGGGASR